MGPRHNGIVHAMTPWAVGRTGAGLYESELQQRADDALITPDSSAGSRPSRAPSARASHTAAISPAKARLLHTCVHTLEGSGSTCLVVFWPAHLS